MDVCHRLSVLRCLVLRSFVLPLRTNYSKRKILNIDIPRTS